MLRVPVVRVLVVLLSSFSSFMSLSDNFLSLRSGIV